MPTEVWDDVVRVLVDSTESGAAAKGLLQAIQLSWTLVAEYSPSAERDWDELPNHLIVLE